MEQVQDINMQDDPYASADNPSAGTRPYYGQIEAKAWFCGLEAGKGKVPYDAAVHQARYTAIDMHFFPLPEMNISYPMKDDYLAESTDWARIVLASIKTLGLAGTREIDGQWVRLVRVPNGKTYTVKRTGETRSETVYQFTALYADEAACRTAYLAESGKSGSQPAAQTATQTAMPTSGGDGEALRKALVFIKLFAKQAGYDLEATKAKCRQQAMITAAIDVDSDKFLEIVAEAAAAA